MYKILAEKMVNKTYERSSIFIIVIVAAEYAVDLQLLQDAIKMHRNPWSVKPSANKQINVFTDIIPFSRNQAYMTT